MKRLNYFQVHKNKKPGKIPKRKPNYKRAHTALIMAMSAIQISSIQSQVFKDKALKAFQIAEVVLQTAEQIQNLYSAKTKYLERIKNKITNGRFKNIRYSKRN